MYFVFFFFFQAEDGIRDSSVTGVQTCALPILAAVWSRPASEGRSPTATSARRATLIACSAEVTDLHIRCRRFWAAHQPGDPIEAEATEPDTRRKPSRSCCRPRTARTRARAERYRRRTPRTTTTAAPPAATMKSSPTTPTAINTCSTTATPSSIASESLIRASTLRRGRLQETG